MAGGGSSADAARPGPVAKARHATRAGPAVAMPRVVPRVIPREGPQIPHRVARTAGAKSLPQPVVSHRPAYPLVRASIHATAYLGDTAHVLLGETHPHRTAWGRSSLEPMLAGQMEAVITALEAEAHHPACTATPRQAVQRAIGSSRRHRPSRRDEEYLAQGWPMGTGVIEGACGHLVQDRLEPSGMRWTHAGARGVLDLRAVRLNGHGDGYGPFHRQQQHQRLDGYSMPVPALVEDRALEWAA